MKFKRRFLYGICLTALLAVGLAACSSRSGSHWKSYGKDADGIIRHLDSMYHGHGLDKSDLPLIDSMGRAASANKAKNAEALACYWRSVAMSVHNPDSALALIRRAAEHCDSVGDPYLFARIKSTVSLKCGDNPQDQYIDLRNLLDYYESARDTAMMIRTYRSLSSFYLNIADYKSFKESSYQVEKLYRQQANDSAIVKNRMNFALYYILQGDSLKAAGIIKKLLADPYARKDSLFMGRLYVDIAMLLHEPDSMLRAIEISPEFRSDLSKRYTLEFAVAGMYNENGDTARCDSMLSYLIPFIEEGGDESARMKLYSILWKRRKARGDVAGALEALEMSCEYADALEKRERDVGIDNYIHRDKVRRIDIRYEQERYETRIRWIIIVLVGILLAAVAILWFWNRHRRAQLAHAKAERDLARTNLILEREQRSLMAMGLAMTERDNLVKDVSDALDEMNRDGRISTDDKKSVNRMIQASQSMRRELDDFRTNFEKVHPEFMKRLMANYPGLSEGDVKLALYISAGLDTKQIAHLLHIRPDSVKKNRQRLRRHMQLPSSTSLEETLRSLTHSLN